MAQGLDEGRLTFCPQDQELVDLFLRPKIAGQPLDARFIHNADLYSAAPDELVDKRAPGSGDGDSRVWYFFTPVHYCAGKNARGAGAGGERKSRTVGTDGNKWWHSEVGQKPVKGSAIGGYIQKFTYKASGTVKPGWLMVEYGIHQEHGSGDLVLCKVYRWPRTSRLGSSSSCSSASSTTTAALSLSLSGSGCKRKAAGDHPEAPPCSVRRQTDEEDDLMLADDIERTLIASSGELDDSAASKYYDTHMPGCEPAVPPRAQGAETNDYHPEAPPCSVLQQTDEEDIECFRFSDDPTPVPGDVDVLPSPEDMESYMQMQGGEPAVLQCAPGSETEEHVGFGSEQLARHCPRTDDGKIVFFDAGVTVSDLLDPTLDECNGGLPCPASAPPCGDELLSASGDTTQTTYTSSGGRVELCSASGDMARPAYDVTDGGRYQLLSTYLPPSRDDDDDDDALLWSENVGTSPLFASSVDAFWCTPTGCWMY